MKKRVLVAALLVMLSLVGCESKPQPPPEPSPSLFPTSIYSIRHTTLDPQGRPLSVFLEVPVFQEEGAGYQKINAFFEQMEKDFFSPKNEDLTSFWEKTEEIGYTQRVEYSAKVLLQTEKLVCVQMSVYYVTGRAFNWTDSYTFDVETGERLMLSDLVEEPEDEALSILWAAMETVEETEPIYWSDIKERALDDFDFFLDNNEIYIAFDVGEVTMTSRGSWILRLPVTLKQEWRSN